MRVSRAIPALLLMIIGIVIPCMAQTGSKDSIDCTIHSNLVMDREDIGDVSVEKLKYPGQFVEAWKWDADTMPLIPQGRMVISRGDKEGIFMKLWVSLYFRKGDGRYHLSERYCVNACNDTQDFPILTYFSNSVLIDDIDHDSAPEIYLAYMVHDDEHANWKSAVHTHGRTATAYSFDDDAYVQFPKSIGEFAYRYAECLENLR